MQPPAVQNQEELEDLDGRAQVRLLLWLGKDEYRDMWTENVTGELATFAETVKTREHLLHNNLTVCCCCCCCCFLLLCVV